MTENSITIKKSIYKSLCQENQHLKAELQRSEQLFQLVIDNIPHSVFWKDRNSVYLGCNRNFAKDAGVSEPENIVGKSDYDLPWKKEEADFFRECDKRVMGSDVPELNIIETQVQADGNLCWLDTNKIPLHDGESNVVGILGTYENVTQRKQVEENLKKLNETLEARVERRTSQLRETEMRLSRLADNVPGMIYQFQLNPDSTMSFPYVSSGCQQISEIESQEVYEDSRLLFTMVYPEDLLKLKEAITKSSQTLQNWESEWRIVTRSGQYKWLKGVSKPQLQPDKSIIWDGCIVDITQRKQAEDALQKLNEELEARVEQRTTELRQAEARLKKLTDNVPGMIYEFCLHPDSTMLFPYVSSGCKEIFELEASYLEKPESRDFIFSNIHPEELPNFQQSIATSAQTFNNWEYEWPISTPSGKQKWLKGIAKPELQSDDSIIWFGCVVDITEIKKTEEELKDTQHFIQSITDSIPNTLYIYDIEEQRNIYANKEIATILGYSDKQIQAWGDTLMPKITHPEDFEKIISQQQKVLAAADGDILELEYRVKHSDSEYRWVYDRQTVFSRKEDGTVKQLLGVVTDITKRKLAEIKVRQKAGELEDTIKKLQLTQAQLIQTEKMSGLGQMVAGVAHEINNPANFIHANLSFICEHTQDLIRLLELYQRHYPNRAPEIQEEIEIIELDFLKIDLNNIIRSMEEGTRRIREIVISLRNFSRLDEAEFKKVNIHEGIDSTLMILQNRLKPKSNSNGIAVIKEYDNLPLIECYPSQLNQVFLNLLVNAIDALEEQIKKNSYSQKFIPKISIYTNKINENTAQICISDNGSGIPQTIISKLFDPFFTTKEVGKGTGLGLSVSYQIIVERHGGKLFCESVLGKGTSFIIEIPIAH